MHDSPRYAVMGCDKAGVPWVVSTYRTAREAVEAAETKQPKTRGLVFYAVNLDDPESSPHAEVEYEEAEEMAEYEHDEDWQLAEEVEHG